VDTDVVYSLSKTLEPKTPKIFMMTDEYSLQDLLEQFKGAMEMSSTPVDLFLVWGVPVLEFLVVVGLGFSQMSGIYI
jgi:hypothetical protein